ncbi:MAG: hypothetical protein Q9159_004953 [Coniocarpon cinnabarinum]
MRFSAGTAAIAGAALATTANAVNPVIIQNQEFVDAITQDRFDVIGIDYQPGGSSGFTGNGDPLSDADACLRDAALMQQLGINTIRVYNLDPTADHDQCVSIFNSVGIYMILDVNSPFDGGSINADEPGPSYDTEYVNRTFLMIDAFREYPNLIGFFGANELINNDKNAGPNPPYIRRDMKQYMSARGGRPLYVGYSAAQVQDVLVSTSNYLQCAAPGENDDNDSRSDYFALNSYSWCGQSNFQKAQYNLLVDWFSNSTIPIFFSEYGCNKVQPRAFTEIPVIYGEQMQSFSGGLVYQWTQDENNYGIVQVNKDGSVKLLEDYDTLKTQFGKIDKQVVTTKNQSATSLQPAPCDAGLISGSTFNTSWDLPAQPSGVQSLIKNGVGGRVGQIQSVTQNSVQAAVTGTNGQTLSNLAINQVSATNPQIPDNVGSSGGSKGGKSSSGAAVPGLQIPEFGMALSTLVAVLAFAGLY